MDEEKRSSSDFIAVGPQHPNIPIGNQLREKLQQWLSPPDPSINHNIARKVHHEGTATWFFQGSIFKEWKSAPSLLWVHGKRTSLLLFITFAYSPCTPVLVAGSGKSVLWFVISRCCYSHHLLKSPQFRDHRRYYGRTRGRNSDHGLFLLRFSR